MGEVARTCLLPGDYLVLTMDYQSNYATSESQKSSVKCVNFKLDFLLEIIA